MRCVSELSEAKKPLSIEDESNIGEEDETSNSTEKYQLTEEMSENRSVNNLVENYQSISIDDKITSSITITSTESTTTLESNSSTTTNSDINSEDDEIRKSDQIPLNVSHLDNDDSSKRLISEESSNLNECENEQNVNDEEELEQPVTTDLTLTKTVEPTEYDPEPIELQVDKPEEVKEIPKEVENKIQMPVLQEKVIVEEPIDIKEMSHNFESTMDDISDAELESLEQELDDLVSAAMADGSLEKLSNENECQNNIVLKQQESIEKTLEIDDKKAEKSVVTEEKIVQNEKMIESENVLEKDETKFAENTIKIEESAKAIDKMEEAKDEKLEQQEEQPETEISEAHELIEPVGLKEEISDPDPALSTSSTDESTSIQNLPSQSNEDSINESNSTGSLTSQPDLGKVPPYWIPDNMTNQCMQCDQKFSLIKRRHHCRACGLLLCSACCSEKFFLHYLQNEGRICGPCHEILLKTQQQQSQQPKHPNPANPSEYCSTLPVQQQVDSTQQTLTIMVPRSGVLKRTSGSTRASSERKSVIFSDGIRPGTDLDDGASTAVAAARSSSEQTKPSKQNLPSLNEKNNSYIPESANELPPILMKESDYKYVDNNLLLLQRLRQEELKFAINKNFYVTVKIVTRE